jgi:hypothetical protein
LNTVDEDDSEFVEAAVEEWTTVAAVFPPTLQVEATLKASCNDLGYSFRPFVIAVFKDSNLTLSSRSIKSAATTSGSISGMFSPNIMFNAF